MNTTNEINEIIIYFYKYIENIKTTEELKLFCKDLVINNLLLRRNFEISLLEKEKYFISKKQKINNFFYEI